MVLPKLVSTLAQILLKKSLRTSVRTKLEQTLVWLEIIKLRLPFIMPRVLGGRNQYPSHLGISLTDRCNLRCFFCRREWYNRGDLVFENIFKLEKAIKSAQSIQLSADGEPLLYPKFEKVLEYLYSKNGNDHLIHLVTNGSRLSSHIARLLSGHLGSITISLNAATAETYNRDMGQGDFEQTISAIREFLSGLDDCDHLKVKLSFVAHTSNFREMPEFVSLANELGISRISILPYQVIRAEDAGRSLLNIKEDYNNVVDETMERGTLLGVEIYARQFFDTEKNHGKSRSCPAPFVDCWILSNGDVVPCCFYDYMFTIGNTYTTSFEEVWFGKAYRRLRRLRRLPVCERCQLFGPFDDYACHILPEVYGSADGSRESTQILAQFDLLRQVRPVIDEERMSVAIIDH